MGEGGFDEILAEVPKGAREFAEIAEDIVESVNKAIDFLLADDEGGENFHDIGVVGGDLGKDAMFLEKRGDDHLREEAFIHGVDCFPGEFEFEGAWFFEFDGDHEAFAADFGDDVVFFLEGAEFGHELLPAEGSVFDEVFGFGDVQAGESAGHGEVVATESGGVGDAAIESGEDALVDGATHNDGGAGDVSTREGFGHGDDIGIKVPVLETEPFSGAAHGGLDFVGNEKGSVFATEFLGGGEVVVGRVLNSFSLDGFKDESGDVAGAEFGFEIGEVIEFDEFGSREEGTEIFTEVARVGDGKGTIGKAVIGAFLSKDAGAFSKGAGELEGAFDRFGSRVAEEAGIAGGAEFFDKGFGEKAGEDGTVHLDHIGEIEFEDVLDSFLDGGMVTTEIKDAVAAEEIEVVLAVEVVEVGAFGAGVDFVEADGALNFDQSTIDVLVVQIVVLS